MVSSSVQISEFSGMATQVEGTQAVYVPALVEYSVGTGSTGPAFSINTRVVRIHARVNVCVEFGQSPTATLNTFAMAAGQTEYVRVNPGDMIAVVADP